MTDHSESESILRTFFAVVAGIIVSVVGLFLWRWVKIWSLDTWSEASFFFMPVLIGVASGLVIRWCCRSGTFEVAGLATIVTALAGLEGVAMQHAVEVDYFLKRETALAYDETLNYAKRTAFLSDDRALQKEMTGSEVAVIGRLAAHVKPKILKDYWTNRNFIHLHWIAARQIVLYGQGGAEKSIWEASRVLNAEQVFLDGIVTVMAKEPIADADVVTFHSWEQPFLQQLARGYISREQFETPLIEAVRSQVSWSVLAAGGFGPLMGLGILSSCIAAYKNRPAYNQRRDDLIPRNTPLPFTRCFVPSH